MNDFAPRLIAWQKTHGRHGLPWQGGPDAYRTWLSEIMLQQTQVATVVPYFERFIARFPDIASLAAATESEVLGLWSGLGYYARGRNLHKTAKLLMSQHGGQFPRDQGAITELPGIGRSTAAAIAAFSFGVRAAILDGNVKRVLARCFGIAGFPGEKAVENRLWALAESLLPESGIQAYTQGLMDLGATVCTRGKPDCPHCPMRDQCIAHLEGRTAELPTPRPKKTIPRRTTRMLLLREDRRILLERRPSTGIWGGLLALPTLPDDCASPLEWIRETLGLDVDGLTPLPPVHHGFTHFHLEILALRGDVVSRRPRVQQDALEWLSTEELQTAALPAPIRRLLEELPA